MRLSVIEKLIIITLSNSIVGFLVRLDCFSGLYFKKTEEGLKCIFKKLDRVVITLMYVHSIILYTKLLWSVTVPGAPEGG